MIGKAFLFIAIFVSSLQTFASSCPKKDVVLAEIDQYSHVRYDGQLVEKKHELDAFRMHCAKRIVVLIQPGAEVQKISDIAFYSSKFGMKTNASNFFVFLISVDKSRMIFLPTMASVRYSRDIDVLKKLISHPPTQDDFL